VQDTQVFTVRLTLMSAHHLPATTVVTALMESTATRVSALKV